MQINLTSSAYKQQQQNGTPQSHNKSKDASPHADYDGCPETPNLGTHMQH